MVGKEGLEPSTLGLRGLCSLLATMNSLVRYVDTSILEVFQKVKKNILTNNICTV